MHTKKMHDFLYISAGKHGTDGIETVNTLPLEDVS